MTDVPALTFVEPATSLSTFNVLCASDHARFFAKIDTRGPDECWPWTGGFFSTGYGAFWLRPNNVGAHRIVCAMHHGPAAGRYALHSCDNPACCNPAHLRWGTPKDNMDDRSVRGRVPIGESHPLSKLTTTSVADIRARAAAGEGTSFIARSYGVTPQAIDRVVRRLVWKDAA